MMTDLSSGPRTPPTAHQAEQRLLGLVFRDIRHLRAVPSFFRTWHLADPAHQVIFTTIQRLGWSGRTVMPHSVAADPEAKAAVREVGGIVYLRALAAALPDAPADDASCSVVVQSARDITDAWVLRQVIDVGEQVGDFAAQMSAAAFNAAPRSSAKHQAEHFDIGLREFSDLLVDIMAAAPGDDARPIFREVPASKSGGQSDRRLTADELNLLADAVERDAREHDRQRGSCPADLHAAERRCAELRLWAERAGEEDEARRLFGMDAHDEGGGA